MQGGRQEVGAGAGIVEGGGKEWGGGGRRRGGGGVARAMHPEPDSDTDGEVEGDVSLSPLRGLFAWWSLLGKLQSEVVVPAEPVSSGGICVEKRAE